MKIIPFSKGQIFMDPVKAAADIMRELRHRDCPMRLCSFLESNDDTMLLVLDDAKKMDFSGYVLSPIPVETENDLPWTIHQRYGAGYNTLAVFTISERRWGLFQCSRELYAENKAKRLKKTRKTTAGEKK